MGWKKLLLGCFCTVKQDKSTEVYGANLSSELSDPRNVALLPKQTSGCRGTFVATEGGVETPIESTQISGCSGYLPAGEICNSLSCEHLTETTDEDCKFIEDNRQVFRETFGPKIMALRDDKSSSEDTSDVDSLGSFDTVVEATPPTTTSADISEALQDMTTSAEDDINCSPKAPTGKPFNGQQRPTVVASRKRRVSPSCCERHDFSKRSVGNLLTHSSGCNELPINALAAAVTEDNGTSGSPSVSSISSDAMQVQKVQVPSLEQNPHDFWQLLRALTGQLSPIVNPSGPKVTRPHNWETDGCICRYLFPPMTSADLHELSTRYSIQQIDSTPIPINIRQLPLPQKAVIEYEESPRSCFK